MANRFLNNITINDEYTLPSADGTADQIITTDGAGQLSFVDQSTLNSGSASRTEILVKNLEGSALSKGDPVYIIGSVGASERLKVGLADAGDVDKMPCVGLLTQDLAINGEGTAIVTGKLKNLITSPIDGATPTENDTIYVKSGGGLTLAKPTGSTNLIQNVGQVGRVSTSSDGNIVVSAILRSNDVPNLPTGKIWVGTANNTEKSAVVHLDEANGRMGIGTDSPGQDLEISGQGNVAIRLTSTDSTTSTLQFGDSDDVNVGMIQYNHTNNHMLFRTNDDERVRITSVGNVGIGTPSPGQKLEVEGNIRISKSNDVTNGFELGRDSSTLDAFIIQRENADLFFRTNNSERMRIEAGGNVGIGTTSPAVQLELGNNGADEKLRLTGTASGKPGMTFYNTTTKIAQISADPNGVNISSLGSGDMNFANGGAVRLTVENGGNVGIGTTSPGAKLDVNGEIAIRGGEGSDDARMYFRASDQSNRFTIETDLDGNTNNDLLGFRSASTDNILVLKGNGNVGIGTTNPSSRLHITDSSPILKLQSSSNASSTVSFDNSSGTRRASLSFIESSDYLSLKNESGSGLVGFNPSQGEFTIGSFSQTGVIINNTSLTLKSNYSTALTCNYIGRVGIGTTNPQAKLDVLGFVNLGSSHTNYAGATYSVNMGFENYNNGFAAIATGQGTLADASQSFSMGYRSKATGVASLAGGNVNTSTALPSESAGEASLAFGNGVKTNTNADFSQAFGRGTATGGGSTTANQAMAMGFGSIAYADNSFSGGNNSNAFGEASFAFGEGATASNADGNIALGIGVTTPTSQYGAYGDGQVVVGKYNVHATGTAHNFAVGTGISDLTRKTDFCVTSAGDVGVGDITPSYKLDVNGTIRATGDVIAFSDIRVKENIKTIGNALDKVKALRGVEYNKIDNSEKSIGVIAQEVEKVIPEVVKQDDLGMLSVAYGNITAVLIEAIKEQQKQIDNLKSRLDGFTN